MFHMLITIFDNELILVTNYLMGKNIKLSCFKILEKNINANNYFWATNVFVTDYLLEFKIIVTKWLSLLKLFFFFAMKIFR